MRSPAVRIIARVVGIIAILVVGLAVELLVFSPVERAVLKRRGLVGH